MRAYIGAKIILAEEGQAPEGHANECEWGYIVEYPDGYRSWSPKNTFEVAYRLVSPGEKELVKQATPDGA